MCDCDLANRQATILASRERSLAGAMNRLHTLIGSCAAWSVALCGAFMAVGWSATGVKPLFLVGIIPILGSYLLLLHLDRRSHRAETLRKETLKFLSALSTGGADTAMIATSIEQVETEKLMSWWASFRHMTVRAYGLVFVSLLIALLASYLLH